MVDSKQKGATAETKAKEELRRLTGLPFERVPMSGALNAKHGLKADLYIPNCNNRFAIEVKHYKEDQFTSKILTGENPMLIQWWEQTVREAVEVDKEPLLVFKYDRSKFFVGFENTPTKHYNYTYVNINGYSFHVSLLNDWIKHESPVWEKPLKK